MDINKKAPHLPPIQPAEPKRKAGSVPALLLLVFFALLSGATAALLVLSYYPDIVGLRFPYDVTQPLITVADKTPSNAGVEARVTEQSVLTLFSASSKNARSSVSWFSKEKSLGSAVLLTEDGWALTTSDLGERILDVVATDYQGRIYTVERSTIDRQSGFAFIKVSASGMPVIPLSTKNKVSLSDTVFSVSGGAFFAHTIVPHDYDMSLPLRSDRPRRFVGISDAPAVRSGSPLFDIDGSLVGVVQKQKNQTVLIPIAAVRSVVKDAIAGDQPLQSEAYISYISMPDVIPLKLPQSAPRVGSYVVGVGATRAGVPLPALRVSDIIVAVNDEPISARADLTMLLSRMRPAQEVLLSVFRDGQYIRIPMIVSL